MFIERGRAGRIYATFTDAEGVQAAPANPTVTITSDLTGEVIVADAEAQVDETLVYYDVQPLGRLDLLAATWKGTVEGHEVQVLTTAEVVGRRICSLEDIRDSVGKAANPTNRELVAARDVAEVVLEDRCGVAFRPRYAREELRGNGREELLVSRPRLLSVLSATVDGEPVQVSPTIAGTVEIMGVFPEGSRVELVYEHGWPVPPPDVREAAIELARDLVIRNPSDHHQRAGRIETAEAIYGFLTTAGVNGAETSIPAVNAVIEARRYRSVG